MTHYVMVIDLERCVGCHACSMACKAENGTPPEIWWNRVLISETGKYPASTFKYLPVLCMHCADAACLNVCPTGATYRRPDGIVAVDYNKCMGCKYCEIACPYGARTSVAQIKGYYPDRGLTPYEQVMYQKHQAGVVEKCTFCMHRVDQGLQPACVATCPTYARTFGDLDDPKSEVSQLIAKRQGQVLKPELGTQPSVYYLSA